MAEKIDETVIAPDINGRARERDIQKDERREDATRDFAEKNRDFVQLSRGTMPVLIQLITVSPNAAAILLAMASRMCYRNTLAFDWTCVQRWTGASKPTIYRALKDLADRNWIKAESGPLGKIYHVNSSVFWSTAQTLKFQSFHRKLIPYEGKTLPAKPAKVDRKNVPVYTA